VTGSNARINVTTGGTKRDPRFGKGYIGARTVGTLSWNKKTGVIEGVLVDKAYQRRGVATAMIRKGGTLNGVTPATMTGAKVTKEGAALRRAMQTRAMQGKRVK